MTEESDFASVRCRLARSHFPPACPDKLQMKAQSHISPRAVHRPPEESSCSHLLLLPDSARQLLEGSSSYSFTRGTPWFRSSL